MKHILISLLLIVPLCMSAKSDDSKYLAGAVPEKDGLIVFTKSFRVPDKTEQQIHDVLYTWADALVKQSIPAPGNYARVMEDSTDSIVVRVCEWMVFKKKALYLDRARFRYQMTIGIEGDKVTISAYSLYYYYGEDPNNEENNQLIKAEEWISDAEALNKAGTKLYPKSGKFRRCTVDYMANLFESAMDAFEQAAAASQPEPQPTRKSVIEE